MVARSLTRLADDGDAVHEEIQRLQGPLRERDPKLVDQIRAAAYRNLTVSNDPVKRGQRTLTFLAMLAAANDQDIRKDVGAFLERRASQYAGMYDGVLAALEREPINELEHGSKTLAIVIAALADGLSLRRRVDETFDHARVFADVIIPIFVGLSRSTDEPQPDWVRRLSGTERPTPSADGVRTLNGPEQTYSAVIDALHAAEHLTGASTIDLASLHGNSERRHLDPSEAALMFRAEVVRLVGQGWTLRRLTTIRTRRRLEQERDGLAVFQKSCRRPVIEVRAIVSESLPLFAPIVIGGDVAILGLEDPHEFGAGAGLELRGSAAQLCAAYFKDLWDDERCIRLRTRAGIRSDGFLRAQSAIDEIDSASDDAHQG